MNTTTHKILLSFLIVVILNLSSCSCPVYCTKQAKESNTVTKVIDGDTLNIIQWGKEESIKLIGIDTPETSVNKKTRKDAKSSGKDIQTIIEMGKEATEYVKGLVKPGSIITIEYDVQERDKYGTLLGYVYLGSGKMLNEEIVKAGYADVMTVPPNTKHLDRFIKAYQEAWESRQGLWAD